MLKLNPKKYVIFKGLWHNCWFVVPPSGITELSFSSWKAAMIWVAKRIKERAKNEC